MAQLGRALRSGRRGRRFKTPPSHGGNRGSIPLLATENLEIFSRFFVSHISMKYKRKKQNAQETEEQSLAKYEEYERKTEELLLPIMEEYSFELVDVEFVKEGSNRYLRAYIDKPGGITIDDCEAVSRRLSDLMDEKDFIEEAYILEVSSPGLGRPLKKEKDFARSLGQEVEVRCYRPIEHVKEFGGILKTYDAKTVTIQENENTDRVLERDNIALIRLAFDF